MLDKLKEKSTEAEKEIEKNLSNCWGIVSRLESSPQRIAGQTVGELRTGSRDLRDPCLFAEFSYNYAKFTIFRI